MNLLIIGGTKFLGIHLINEAISRGHEVTIFNRGTVESSLLPDSIEYLVGDRDGNLSALEGRKWDAVIDTCGYVPRVVRKSAQLLSTACDQYAFISSISVYNDFSKEIGENSEVGTLKDESVEEVTGETYGPLKALCENEVKSFFPEGALIIRPGLIVGPNDPTDRFTYWPVRVANGGDVLVPDSDHPVQFIDVRDLAAFTLTLLEEKKAGTYNVTGPKEQLRFKEFLEECKRTTKSDATFTAVSNDFLQEQKVGYWMELPLYIPESDENMKSFLTAPIQKAISDGLQIRPLSVTIEDTVAWDRTRNISADDRKAGLHPQKEAEVLKKWNEKELIL
ncbi:NAD-dependent epimerase/dehydratase family protein [Cytobacillus suaedae]|nr:NAD-dependent epimerase/dehydratase family protein [Cytobacillus suaedae]